ncbi:MAG: hypothetical protein ACTH2Y_14240 [Corynebacterium sp.]|uniref:hypothetical protein n=1 Tax=Corynebacterium sp. TaxID=1720 RepID=UPI003F8E6708
MTEITDQDRRDMLEWARIAVASKDNQEHDPWVTAARYILAPDPQIIRTPAELEALDPHMVVIDRYDVYTAREYIDADRHGQKGYERDLPAVAVDVRACREALEGEAHDA